MQLYNKSMWNFRISLIIDCTGGMTTEVEGLVASLGKQGSSMESVGQEELNR